MRHYVTGAVEMFKKILRLLFLLVFLFSCVLPTLFSSNLSKFQASQASQTVTQESSSPNRENRSRLIITSSPVLTPTPVSIAAKINSSANVRSGPGTTFEIVGGKSAGDAVIVRGCNAPCDWYQLSTGEWVAEFLVTVEGVQVPLNVNDPAVQKYIILVTTNLQSIAGSMDSTFETLGQFTDNPLLIYDVDWQASLVVDFVGIKYPCRVITEADVPRDFNALHTQLTEGCTHLANMVDYTAKLLETGDLSYADIIEKELDLGLSLFTSVGESLDKMADERTVTKVVPVPTMTPVEPKYSPILVPTSTPVVAPTAILSSNL